MFAPEVYRPPSVALAACVHRSPVFEWVSLCLSVVVPSPWLIWTPGVGEGCSCPKARVEAVTEAETRVMIGFLGREEVL